jgi:hypothetical protein
MGFNSKSYIGSQEASIDKGNSIIYLMPGRLDPFFALTVIFHGWVFPFLDACLQATFVVGILIYWLSVADGIRQVNFDSGLLLFIPNSNLVSFRRNPEILEPIIYQNYYWAR